MRNARKIPYLPLWAAKLRLSRKRLGLETRIMSTSYIFRPYPLPKTYRKRDGIWERMRKVKPPPLAAESLTSTQIIVTRNVLVVRVRARADMPRENTDAIGDSTRRKYVNAVNAFKYPPKKNGEPMSSASSSPSSKEKEEEMEKSPDSFFSLGERSPRNRSRNRDRRVWVRERISICYVGSLSALSLLECAILQPACNPLLRAIHCKQVLSYVGLITRGIFRGNVALFSNPNRIVRGRRDFSLE